MKQQSKTLLTLLHGVGVGVSAITALSGSLLSTEATAGISNTRHNLGANGPAGGNKVSDTGEVCVFCHTPHAAATGANTPPLWNKNLVTGATYTTYATSAGSGSMDASANNGSVATGSISLACLSCHDGTQAMDNILNAPGSGGVTGGGGATGLAYTWTASTGVDANGRMTNAATTLGADLRNDHPIGIAYCGGQSGAYAIATATCRDGDFNAMSLASGAVGTSDAVYYVNTGGAATRDKSDIQLYTRDFGGANNWKPSVECGSCHDPHVETKATNQVAFLRVSQTSSALCLACHNK